MTTKSPGSKRRMRRPATTLLVLAAATALILSAVAGPVAAKRHDGAKLKVRPFVCKGEVTAVPAANSLKVKVVRGKRAVVGKQVTFTLAGKAVIMKVGADGAEVIGLGDVRIGDRVLVHGRVDLTTPGAPTYTAWLILDRGPAPLK
jgi:hypothetical protein